MKITIVGNRKWEYSAENDWCHAFNAEGHKAVVLHEPTSTEDSILEAARSSDFLLWVPSKRYHSKDLVERCKKQTLVVGWHPDLFWGLSRKNWQELPLWQADFVFTADGGHDNLWKGMGVNHQWLLPGVREWWTAKKGRPRDGFLCDVAFVGNDGSSYHPEWPYRKDLLANLQIICAKNGWVFRNPGGQARSVQRDRRMNDFYASAKVVVGDSLCLDRENSLYWSDRVYETLGRGGLLLMPQIHALSSEFSNLLPMYPWGDWRALERKIGAFLDDPEGSKALSQNLRGLVAENHTYNCRVKQLLEKIGA